MFWPTPSFPRHAIRCLGPNLKGDDYIVGDIHGNFLVLGELLEKIGFRCNRDRLICVGDLIDRNVDSPMVVDFLKQPGIFSVRGNHEDLFLTWAELRRKGLKEEAKQFFERRYQRNGGGWALEQSENTINKIYDALVELPYGILADSKNGRSALILHAELPLNWTLATFKQQLAKEEVRNHERSYQHSAAFLITWGVSRYMRAEGIRTKRSTESETMPSMEALEGYDWDIEPADPQENAPSWIEDVDCVISGHLTLKEPKRIGNVFYIDTGGWKPTDKGRFTLKKLEDFFLRLDQANPDDAGSKSAF